MIWATIKKHGLLFWRNRSQLFLLIGLPFILITILGFSLGGFMSGDAISSFDVDVALIEEEDEDAQIDRFIQSLGERDLPQEQTAEIKQQAGAFAPIEVVKQTMSEKLDGIVNMETVDPGDKEGILDDDKYAALIEVPENFTFRVLDQMFLNQGNDAQAAPPQLQVYQNQDESLEAQMVVDIIASYNEQIALQMYTNEHGLNPDVLATGDPSSIGSSDTVGNTDSVSAQTYYAIGMVTMNILFVAMSIAMWAYHEREMHIFNRVVISRTARHHYVFGIFVAGTFYALAQALVIYGLSLVFFQIYWPDVWLFMLVTASLALAVGGLAALLSAISYRLDSLAITSLFGSFIIYIFAFLGGSFFPVGDLSPFIGKLGDFTPNGAGMTAYLSIMRGGSINDILPYAGSLSVVAAALFILALVIFPKRGGQV